MLRSQEADAVNQKGQTPEEAEAFRYSAEHYAEIAILDSSKFDVLRVICAIHQIRTLTLLGAWDEGLNLAEKLHRFLKNVRSENINQATLIERTLAMTFLESANIIRLLGDYDRAQYRFGDARRLFSRIGDSKGEIAAQLDLTVLHIQAGELGRAAAVLDQIESYGPLSGEYESRLETLRAIIHQQRT